MEVARKRIFLRHLEPARPLRRDIHVNLEPQNIPSTKMMHQEGSTFMEQFYKKANPPKPVKGRISYSRELLIHLASSPEAQKKPEYLPDHPITLSVARGPDVVCLPEMQGNKEN